MTQRWKYPFYVIAVLLLVLWLTSCDSQTTEPFSVEVTVETTDGEPVSGATVWVQPCYESDGVQTPTPCGSDEDPLFSASSSDSTRPHANLPRQSEPVEVTIEEPDIRPFFPNPFQEHAVLGVALPDSSTVQATVHTLDGTKRQTLVHTVLAPGRHRRRWGPDDLTTGLYQLRTRIRTEETLVAADTVYAVLLRNRSNTFRIGTTEGSGTVSTTARAQFPPLFEVPPIEVRDAQGIALGTLEVAPTVQFLVRTPEGVQQFFRPISPSKNTVTLSLSP